MSIISLVDSFVNTIAAVFFIQKKSLLALVFLNVPFLMIPYFIRQLLNLVVLDVPLKKLVRCY